MRMLIGWPAAWALIGINWGIAGLTGLMALSVRALAVISADITFAVERLADWVCDDAADQ